MMTACTQEGDVSYQVDASDAASTSPLVTVIYDPVAVGDGGYNDLIYQGVEQTAKKYGLRTMHLSPSSREEGLAYLDVLFQQMSVVKDSVRRLFIVAASSYDDYVRKNHDRLASNALADLLYLETKTPLAGKGSTLYVSFYGAMYEAGALVQALSSDVLLVGANPHDQSVKSAVDGFTNGFLTEYIPYPDPFPYQKLLFTEYLSQEKGSGFSVADTTAMRIMYARDWKGLYRMVVPICGGAARTFQHLCDLMEGYNYMGIDSVRHTPQCPLSAVKHIDRAVSMCITQWLSAEGMPKHQSLGLADGYTDVEAQSVSSGLYVLLGDVLTEELVETIHQDAIRKEGEYEK